SSRRCSGSEAPLRRSASRTWSRRHRGASPSSSQASSRSSAGSCCAHWPSGGVDALDSRPVVETRSTFASRNRPSFGAWCVIPTGASLGRPDFSTEAANRDVVCLVMIETSTGLANVDEIAAVAGLDGIYVGPNDLGLSLGLPPMLIDHGPVLTEAIAEIADACARHGIVAGVAGYEPDAGAAVEKWQGVGYTLFGLPSDSLLLRRAVDGLVQSLGPQ